MADYFFPLDSAKTAWNSTFKPNWDVKEQISASGRRRALCTQLYPSYTFTVTFPLLNDKEREKLLAFYSERRGSFQPFYYKDPLHHRVNDKTLTRNEDGTYCCYINDAGEVAQYVDNITVNVDGVPVTDYMVTDGHIAFLRDVTGVVTASYDYYWRVVFANQITITELFYNANKVGVTLKTVR